MCFGDRPPGDEILRAEYDAMSIEEKIDFVLMLWDGSPETEPLVLAELMEALAIERGEI